MPFGSIKKKTPTSRLQVFGEYVYWDGQPIASLLNGSGNLTHIRQFIDAVLDLDKAIQLREELTDLFTQSKTTHEALASIVHAVTRAEGGTNEHNPFKKLLDD